MSTNRISFIVGALAIVLAGLGLASHYGGLDWRLLGVIVPLLLVVIAAGMLLLTRKTN